MHGCVLPCQDGVSPQANLLAISAAHLAHMWRVLVCCCTMQGVAWTAASAAHAVRLNLSNQLHGLNAHAQEVSSAETRMCPCLRV
jgi:hypothetical protein